MKERESNLKSIKRKLKTLTVTSGNAHGGFVSSAESVVERVRRYVYRRKDQRQHEGMITMTEQETTTNDTSLLKTAGLIGAGAAGSVALLFGAAGIAGAQDDGDAPTLDDPAPAEESANPNGEARRENREARRQAMVDQLVEDGVISSDQVDDWQAVRDALREQHEAQRAEKIQGVADVLGVTVEDLQAAREAGDSLADIAGDDIDALVDYFVDEATERIETALADGNITQEQADERLDGLADRIQTRIEDGGGFGGRGGHHHRGGRGGPGAGGAGFGPGDGAAAAVATNASF